MAGGTGVGFLGTDLVLISRLMAAAAEQVDEFESILDSVLVTASERQTLRLNGTGNRGLTLDGLLSWIRVFLTEDGPMYARDSGRDGMRTAFAPTAARLLGALRASLIVPMGKIQADAAKSTGSKHPREWIPANVGKGKLPPGMHSARSRIAAASLSRLLIELFSTAAKISRYPGVVLLDVELEYVRRIDDYRKKTDVVRVSVRGANLRPTYFPAFYKGGSGQNGQNLIKPLDNSVTSDDDTLVGLFALRSNFAQDLQKWSEGVLLPAESLPIAILDSETGTVITAPPVRTWPRLKQVPKKRRQSKSDWSDVRRDGSALAGPAPSGVARKAP